MTSTIEQAKSLLSPPGDTIQETIDLMGMSQAELAERMGRPKEKINEIIKGKEPISTATAFKLENVLGVPASFWLNRENEYREQIYQLEQEAFFEECLDWLKLFPIREMCKFGWLPQSRNKQELVEPILKFFGVASPGEWKRIYVHEEIAVSFRISLANTKNPFAVSAWLRMGELQSKKLDLKEYDKKKFKDSLIKIKELAFAMPSDFKSRLQEICANCGVALVYTPNLPKAPISGAARWFHNIPIIQLSGRFKTDDHFWFTFFHEAGHILLHGKKDVFLENLDGAEIDDFKEEEANNFASKQLLSQTQLNEIIASSPLDDEKINRFSTAFKVSTGIIIGRLQYVKYIDFSEGNHLKQKINLFD
ncbi:HigA family addiction module antitoxin [Flagellimonas sediminis]|uniref:HigA family addiction module antidote protein n=1 Tax=Flagellimonas sediminis TaxID=2696468 RepID=A0A6I5KX91_9FLAO|nr:HigA family addiction module antitoxin [Allomuricauda sediminis]NDV42061.1 HigA family addiction module antidote protein [Allomuricauda sediminis]